MAENKTKPEKTSVQEFINSVEGEQKRKDCLSLLEIFKSITKDKPVMWGTSIIGFGEYHYKYDSGREGDFLITGFSPRKAALTLYLMGAMEFPHLLEKLGKHTSGVGCIYIKKLADIDMMILNQLIAESYAYIKAKYPSE
jgi:hypothetical protein